MCRFHIKWISTSNQILISTITFSYELHSSHFIPFYFTSLPLLLTKSKVRSKRMLKHDILTSPLTPLTPPYTPSSSSSPLPPRATMVNRISPGSLSMKPRITRHASTSNVSAEDGPWLMGKALRPSSS